MSVSDLEKTIQKLNQIGIALSSETNLERLLSLVVREVRGFTHADAGSLYIRDGENLRFEVAQNDTIARRGAGQEEKFRPFPLPLTRTSIAGYVALTARTLNIEDVYELGRDPSCEFSFNRDFDQRNDYRSRSMLVVPMLDHRGENIGVLQLINALDDENRVIPFPKEVEPLVLSLASQAAVAVRNAQLIASIKNVFAALVRYSASAIDARSPHTAGHSRRVAHYALLLAEAVNRRQEGRFAQVSFTQEEMEELSYSAWLHDIGKIGVREQVLEKAGKLSTERLETIRTRFNLIGAGLRLEYQLRMLNLCRNGAPDPAVVAALEAEREARLAELAQEQALVEKVNIPGFVTDAELERLTRIAAKKFDGPDGMIRPYLDDFELENLSVRKGNLTEAEYREIQSHVVHTSNIIQKIPFTPELARIPQFAAAHHEMLNGTGYPDRLQGDQIPLQARILGVVDIFDALVASDRPYKKAMPAVKAQAILKEEAERGRLDPDLVELFISEGIGDQTMVDSLARHEDSQTKL
ncbi:MAG: HD domain-containing phosphohydrolase [Thermodesulfobacteriota bacterium]